MPYKLGRLEHNFRVAGIDSKTQQGELLKTSLDVIDEESNESFSYSRSDAVSSRSIRSIRTNTSGSKIGILNSFKEIKKSHIPK
jgi:hypothetical protein